MLKNDPLPPAQQLRALIGYLGLGERAAGTELGVSRTLLRAICNGISLPDGDCRQRIKAMSIRWPHGIIDVHDWPSPPPVDRRKTKPRKALPIPPYELIDPILGSDYKPHEVSPPEDFLEAAPDELTEE